jgi:disulfide bond formation protein DsbB
MVAPSPLPREDPTMTLTRPFLIALALAGSAALLAGAFAFQHIGGMFPCQLCLWQRWPHAAAVVIGLVALATGWRGLAWAGALAALATAGIGVFHVGVEQGWWQGLAACTGGSIAGISTADLLNPAADVAAPVRCDAIAWQLLGISMAGWNVLVSLGLAGVWVMAALRRTSLRSG